MPSNLSPELLALLQGGDYTASNIAQHWQKQSDGKNGVYIGGGLSGGYDSGMGDAYLDPATGRYIVPRYEMTQNGGAEGGTTERGALAGYSSFDAQSGNTPGSVNYTYNPDGSYSGEFETAKYEIDKGEMLAMAMIAAMTGGAAMSAMGAGGAAAGGAASSAPGGGMVNGAFLGEGAWAPTLGGGAMPGGFASTAGAVGGAAGGGGAASGGGLLSSLGGSSSLLGPAASLIGGIAGAQGTPGTSSSRTMDPRMDPYIFGNQNQTGLLQYAAQQLGRDMSPERLGEWGAIRDKGMGLLQQPIAGNGFDRFFPGR